MKIESDDINRIETIKQNLNDIVNYGGIAKRQDILDAEEISFNNALPQNIIYDKYGFIIKNDKPKKK